MSSRTSDLVVNYNDKKHDKSKNYWYYTVQRTWKNRDWINECHWYIMIILIC